VKDTLVFFVVVDRYQAKGIAVPKDLQNVGLVDECSLRDFIKSLFKGPQKTFKVGKELKIEGQEG